MKDGKKIIARVFSAYDGPADYYLFERMKMIDREKFETICIYIKQRSDEPNPLEDEGFKCFYISRQRYFKCFNLAAIFKIARICKRQKVDILHCNRHQATIYGTLAAIIAKVPVVLSHVHGLNRSKKPRRKLTYRLLGRRISRFLACSKGVADDILANFPTIKKNQVAVLANSIDYDRYANAQSDINELRDQLSIPRESFVFLAAGRFVPTKDYNTLIKAFGKVVESDSNCRLLMIGGGRDIDKTKEFVNSMGVTDTVLIPGRREDVSQIMKICDCFVMSSIAEGMPLVLLEAMSSGLPCLATNVGGIPEVINSDQVGRVVAPGDADALAEAMMEYVEMDDQKRSFIIENARLRVKKHFSHESLVAKVTEFYENELNLCSHL